MSSALERRYHLLLGAYPPEYLDRHEEEILGTLLDGAKPGQVRPSLREASSLVVAGIRARSRLATAHGRPRLWADSIRLAALLLLASVLSDQVAMGSEPVALLATASVACGIVAVVIGASRLGALLVASALVTSVVATARWEVLLPASWEYDVACIVTIAVALGTLSFLPGTNRPWRWWLAVIAIAMPFLYRVFWLDVTDATLFRIPASVFELTLPVSILCASALLLRDPRPAIAATVYAALHLVVPITFGVELAGIGIDAGVGLLTLGLTVMSLAVSIASSRRMAEDQLERSRGAT